MASFLDFVLKILNHKADCFLYRSLTRASAIKLSWFGARSNNSTQQSQELSKWQIILEKFSLYEQKGQSIDES